MNPVIKLHMLAVIPHLMRNPEDLLCIKLLDSRFRGNDKYTCLRISFYLQAKACGYHKGFLQEVLFIIFPLVSFCLLFWCFLWFSCLLRVFLCSLFLLFSRRKFRNCLFVYIHFVTFLQTLYIRIEYLFLLFC